jgi:hypothetical protein
MISPIEIFAGVDGAAFPFGHGVPGLTTGFVSRHPSAGEARVTAAG